MRSSEGARLRESETYREVTVAAVLTGVAIGVGMTATFAYAGMTLGFSTTGSTVAAILGWGVLRGLLRRGTIVENNIVQTIASSMNTTAGGVVFTVPVVFLLPGVEFQFWQIATACVAGAVLGVGLIIPLRKQMIEIERLLFPSGTAVASILKSPAQGVTKSRLMILGGVTSAIFFLLKNLDKFPGVEFALPGQLDLGAWWNLPPYVETTATLSLFAVGIGFIAGRNGLFVLVGGIVAYWIITPLVVHFGWGPAAGEPDLEALGQSIHSEVTRPMGIGMLLGGSLMSVVLTLPAVKAAITSLSALRSEQQGRDPDELGSRLLIVSAILGFLALFATAYWGIGDSGSGGLVRALGIALVGSIWLWFAGVIIAQATGMTDWTPLSGLALLAVVILLYLSGGSILPAVMMGAAVSVACSLSADMMQDLKTGQWLGSRPRQQQLVQLAFAPLGPLVALGVVYLIWSTGPGGSGGFGPGTAVEVPQASSLQAVIDQVDQGRVDWLRYGASAAVGGLLSLSGLPGLGVIVGISMYLGLGIILPYGFGALAREIFRWFHGESWCHDRALPVAVGLIVGDGLMTLLFGLLTVAGVLQ